MREQIISRMVSAAVVGCVLLVPAMGCAKRVASSAGEGTASAKERKAGLAVETITPEAMPPLPDEKTAPGTMETGRGPAENAGSALPPSSGGSSSSPAVSSDALSAQGTTPAVPSAADQTSLADVFFDFDQHTIRSDAQSTLSANAAWISSQPGQAIVIEGHCDERGTQAYNLVLGDKRARSVKHYLEELGVPASRLKTTSYGELRPFCKERNETCYQQNRRAHFVVH